MSTQKQNNTNNKKKKHKSRSKANKREITTYRDVHHEIDKNGDNTDYATLLKNIKDDKLLISYGHTIHTLLYYAATKPNIRALTYLIKECKQRFKNNKKYPISFVLNRGNKSQKKVNGKHYHITPLSKILLTLRKKRLTPNIRLQYRHMALLLIINGVNVDCESVMEPHKDERKSATDYQIVKPIEIAFSLYDPEIFLAIMFRNIDRMNHRNRVITLYENPLINIQQTIHKLWYNKYNNKLKVNIINLECNDCSLGIFAEALRYLYILKPKESSKRRKSRCVIDSVIDDNMIKYYKCINDKKITQLKAIKKFYHLPEVIENWGLNIQLVYNTRLSYTPCFDKKTFHKERKGLMFFIAVLPKMYNLRQLHITWTKKQIESDGKYCFELLKSLNIQCIQYGTLNDIKLKGLKIVSESMSWLSESIINWSDKDTYTDVKTWEHSIFGILIFGYLRVNINISTFPIDVIFKIYRYYFDKNVETLSMRSGKNQFKQLQRLSLINVHLDNKCIEKLCNAMKISKVLRIKKIILHKNVFDIVGLTKICRFIEETDCKYLNHLEIKNCHRLDFDHSHFPCQIFLLIMSCIKQYNLVLCDNDECKDNYQNENENENECNAVCDCIFNQYRKYFTDQKYISSELFDTKLNEASSAIKRKKQVKRPASARCSTLKPIKSKSKTAFSFKLPSLNQSETQSVNMRAFIPNKAHKLFIDTCTMTPNETIWNDTLEDITKQCNNMTVKMKNEYNVSLDGNVKTVYRLPVMRSSKNLSTKLYFQVPLSDKKKSKRRRHSHDLQRLRETDDFLKYDAANKYLFIQIESIEHILIEFDKINVFDFEYLYIKLSQNQCCSLTLSVGEIMKDVNHIIRIDHMLCVENAKKITFDTNIELQATQMWLKNNKTIHVGSNCTINTLTSWYYNINKIINKGILEHIAHCFIDHAPLNRAAVLRNENKIISHGYFYCNLNTFNNINGTITTDVMQHIKCDIYDDKNGITNVFGIAFYEIGNICNINGNISADVLIFDVKNKFRLNSKLLKAQKHCFIHCQNEIKLDGNCKIIFGRDYKQLSQDTFKQKNPKIFGYNYNKYTQLSSDNSTPLLKIKSKSLIVNAAAIEDIGYQFESNPLLKTIIAFDVETQCDISRLNLLSNNKVYLLNTQIVNINSSTLNTNKFYINILNGITCTIHNNLDCVIQHQIENIKIESSTIHSNELYATAINSIECKNSTYIYCSDRLKVTNTQQFKTVDNCGLYVNHDKDNNDKNDSYYECILDIKELFSMEGIIKGHDIQIITNKCTIVGEIESNKLLIDVQESVDIVIKKSVNVRNSFLINLQEKNVIHNDQNMVIQLHNNNHNGESKISVNKLSVCMTNIDLKSQNTLTLLEIEKIQIDSSIISVSLLYMDTIDSIICNAANVYCSKILKVQTNEFKMINGAELCVNENNVTNIDDTTLYNCIMNIKDLFSMDDGVLKGGNIQITTNKCIIVGELQSNKLLIDVQEFVDIVIKKSVKVRNSFSINLQGKNVIHNDQDMVIQLHNNKHNGESKISVNKLLLCMTNVDLKSQNTLTLLEIEKITIDSSIISVGELYIDTIDNIIFNAIIHCQNQLNMLNINNLEMSANSELYTAQYGDIMLKTLSENKSITNAPQSMKHKSADVIIEILENVDVLCCYIQIQSIMRKCGKLYDDELIKIKIHFNELPSEDSTYYICESGTNNELAQIEIQKHIQSYTAFIDLIDLMEENFINTTHSLGVCTDIKNPTICSNLIQCTVPNLVDYVSETEPIPETISIDTVQATFFNNVVNIYWDYPSKLNMLASMEMSFDADIKYGINYLNCNGSTTKSTINGLPLTMQATEVPVSFSVTTIINKNGTEYESQPSKVVTVDFAATSKQNRVIFDQPTLQENSVIYIGADNSTEEFKTETQINKFNASIKHEKQHDNDVDSFECIMEINKCFKMCGIMKAHNIKLLADECNIEGFMESNVLSIDGKSIHFGSNNLFIKTEKQLNIMLVHNCVFLSTEKLLIKPIDDHQPPIISIDPSQMIVEKCKIESYGYCAITNIPKFCCMKSSQLHLNHATFNQIRCMEVLNNAEINCSNIMNVKDVDTFMMNDSTLSTKDGCCTIELNSLFSIDNTSNIYCSYEHFKIVCDQDIKLNGNIEIDERCTFKLFAKQQILCNGKCQIQSKSVFKNPEQQQIEMMIEKYLKNHFQQTNFESNYYIHFYGMSNIDFNGKITGNESLCIMQSDETVRISDTAVFKTCDLYAYSVEEIIFNSKYYHANGKCSLSSDKSLNINKKSVIQSDKASFYGKESITMNGEVNGSEIYIESQNECNMECNKINASQLIIKTMNLNFSKQSLLSKVIDIECKKHCKILNTSNISCTKQLTINSSSLQISDSTISATNESEMIWNIFNKAEISNACIESDIFKMINTNSLAVTSTKMTINQIFFKNIKSLKCCTGTEMLYLSKFHAENIQQFIINTNVMISINHGCGHFDSNGQNEFCVNTDDFSLDNGAKIYFSSQKAEIKCNNNLNLNGIIHMLKSNTVNEEKTKTLTWQHIQINDLTQSVVNHLAGQHYIQLYAKNTLHINGELIAPNSLSLIDCTNAINILENAKMNTGMLYIRSIRDINFNGRIYNENGECFIGANNKLTLHQDGDICLLFLKYWSSNTEIHCTITADNLTVQQLEKRLNTLNDKINNFSSIKENDDELKELRRKLEIADRKYKRSTREISDTIDKTGLSEQNIRLFLEQLNKIRDCVIQQPVSLAKMNQKLSTFITLMRREFNTELTIESYFDFQNLKKYANALQKEGYMKLKELECDNENDAEYQKILSTCQKVKGFNARDKRELQHICLKSDSWKRYQNEKINVVTKQMAETAPLLKDCFGSIDNAMGQIQIATKNALESSKKNQSFALKAKNPTNTLHKAAEESLKTISKFKKDKCKEYKGDKVIKLKALTVATGITDCCSEIIKNQQRVAGSILLTKSILKLKPNEHKKKEKNQSLEMRVKERVGNAIKQAWVPYIEQRNRLKALTHGRKKLKKKKQIKLHVEEKKQNVVEVIDNFAFPLCFIQVVSVHQKISKIMDDEKIKISVEINKIPSKKATYYVYECKNSTNDCLATIQVRKNKTRYDMVIDLIEFEPDSENEMDENNTIKNRNCKRVIALYKDKKKRKIISNCIEIILPEFDEYLSKEIPKTVPISTIKACKMDTGNISIFWQCPPKINVFGTISVKYKVNFTDKNHNKTQKTIDRLPLTISNKHSPISMQIITIISTKTQIIESRPIEFVVTDFSKYSTPSVNVKETSKRPKIKNNKSKRKPQVTDISIPSANNNNKPIKHKQDVLNMQSSFKYRPSNYSGIYGSYQIQPNTLKPTPIYRASFSSGIYGSYFYQEERKYTEIERKENECLELLYSYLSKSDNKNVDYGRKLRKWIRKKKFNLENICQDITNPKISKIKSFDCAIFKKLVTFTKTKTWKMKHKEFKLMSSAKLWNIVDDGVINIWSSDLVIIEIAMKYFNFFGKFRQSFDKLVKLNPQQTKVQAAKNKAKSFLKNMVSTVITISNEDEKIDVNRNNQIVQQLECIANDIQEFELIQKIFHSTINQLEKFALKCIRECIKEAPNSTRFENAQKQREKYRAEFEKLQKSYNEKEKQMNNKYDKWIALKLKLQARKTAAEYEQRQKQNQK